MSLLITGCAPPQIERIAGSGNVVTQEFDLSGFDKVDISYGFITSVRQGDAFGVVIRIDDNLLDELRVEVEEGMLVIGFQPHHAYNIQNATMQAVVVMPKLTGLDLSGGTRTTITGFASDSELDINLSSGSVLRGDIQAGDTKIDASGAGRLDLNGSANRLHVEASGTSRVDLSNFSVREATVEASGGSKVSLNASGTLNAEASGGTQILYAGNPTLGQIDTSGGAQIKPR